MERQEMKDLELFQAPAEFDPLESQRELQRKIWARGVNEGRAPVPHHATAVTYEQLLQRIRFNHEADAAEKIEMLDWLPWKSWKTYEVYLDKPVDEDTRLELKFELIDRFHFMLNEALALGMTWSEFMDIFFTKQLENHRRQGEGY